MKKIYLLFSFISVFFIHVIKTNAQVASQDSLALVDLYDSTNGSSWTTKTNWLSGNVSTWYGITISSNRVTGISMNNNNIVGAIPSSIGNLSALTSIYLNSNKITSLPEELSNISTLTIMRMESNQFSFPFFVGKMTQLIELDLSGNKFSISFPDTLYKLTNAKMINIGSCSISGSLDSRISQWPKLTWMYFGYNNLSGAIPSNIGMLTNMTFLELNNNQLSGSLPTSIGNLSTKLSYLRLNNNKFNGHIPDTLYSLLSLKELNLHDNYFSGSVSPLIAKLTSLTTLYLYNDSLVGTFPPSIDSLVNLQYLEINNNMFDSFPDISALKNISYLYLQDNKFTFEDIEPNISVATSSFTYSPQDSVKSNLFVNLNSGDTLLITSTIGGTINAYQWYKNGVAISGATDDTLKILNVTALNSGAYSCKITNAIASALKLYRKSVFVTVSSITSITPIEIRNQLNVYPNPSENGIYNLSDFNTNKMGNILSVFNITGEKIMSISIGKDTKQIDLSTLSKGTYIATIENENGKQTIKIIR